MDARAIKIALPERYVVALTLWGEARAEFDSATKKWRRAPRESREAIGSVIRNRVRYPGRFGANPKDVCLKPWAFSCWVAGGGASNFMAVMQRAESFIEKGDNSPYLIADPVLRESLLIADAVITQTQPDRVSGACHYHADWMEKFPIWADPKKLVAEISNHLFYAGVK